MPKIVCVIFSLLLLPCCVFAQQTKGDISAKITNMSDSVAVFKFNGKDNMFLWVSNQNSITRFDSLVNGNIKGIEGKNTYILVNGFCTAFDSVQENLWAVKNRSDQVKSYFITHFGIRSENFKTLNTVGDFFGQENLVAVTLFSTKMDKADDNIYGLTPEQIYQEELHADWTQYPMKQTEEVAVKNTTEPDIVQVDTYILTEKVKQNTGTHFTISTNALYWCALLPNCGVSYRFAKRLAFNTTGGYTWWSFSNGRKTYYIWEVEPSFSFFLSKDKEWRGHYFSAYWHSGRYDIKTKNDGKGHQGDYWGAGIEYGYIFRIGRSFDLSLHLRAGYVFSNYKAYSSQSLPCYDYLYSNNKHIFSITGAGVSFIYRIGGNK